MDVERQALVALKWSALAKVLGQLLSWAVTLLVLRILVPTDYGLYAIVSMVISTAAGLAEFGLGASLIQAPTLDRRELSRIAGALCLLNIVCGLLVAASAHWLAEVFREPRLSLLIRVSSLQFAIFAIEVLPQAMLHRGLHFARVARNEVASTIVATLSTLLLAAIGGGVWALVVGGLLGATVRAALFVSAAPVVWPSFRLLGIGRHVKFGGIVSVTRLVWQLTYQIDTLIAARFLSREALGLYSVAMHLATMPMDKAMGIVNQVALPAVARLQNELPRVRTRLLESLRLLAFMAIPSLWGIAAVAPEFVDIVLGAKWEPAITVLQLVSLAAPARMLAAVLATALLAIGAAEVELRNTVVGALILPASLAVGVHWNLDGLAASWGIGVLITCVLNFSRTSAALGLTLTQVGSATRAPLLAGCLMYLAVWAVRLPLRDSGELTRLSVLILAGGATYVTGALALDRAIWTDMRRIATALRS